MKTLVSILFFVAATVGMAQDSVKAEKSANPVLNGKAIILPRPGYPEVLRGTDVSAAIAVIIEVDENGAVVHAKADINDQKFPRAADVSLLDPILADPLLRAAAEEAALKAIFPPSPVRVSGRLIYNFVGDGAAMNGIPKTVSTGNVLNGKAVSLAMPAYPAAARAVRAQGAVSIQVMIDEEGIVRSASALSGHPLLRAAAENAAYEARFAPTLLAGKAVKVAGVLTYNFVP
ncbi:MAG: TonB family protein [Pyrinomonadaceae bacterium]